MRTERNYVNGHFVAPESDAFIPVHNPATEGQIARVKRSPPSMRPPPRGRHGASCRVPSVPLICTGSPMR